METLLASGEKNSIIGDSEGNIKSIHLPENQTLEERERWLEENFKQPNHTSKTAEHIEVFTYGGLIPTDKPHIHHIETLKAEVRIRNYTDEESGITIREAFDPFLYEWTLADL